jgi:hypothetical protein
VTEKERPNIVEQLIDPATGRPRAQGAVPKQGGMIEGLDADNIKRLKADPSHTDAQIDVNVDESFPASDPSGISQPGAGKDPRPGGKYN